MPTETTFFLLYFSLQAKNSTAKVQGYEDYSKLRALHIWMKLSTGGWVVRLECRYFHLACINFVFLIHSSYDLQLPCAQRSPGNLQETVTSAAVAAAVTGGHTVAAFTGFY